MIKGFGLNLKLSDYIKSQIHSLIIFFYIISLSCLVYFISIFFIKYNHIPYFITRFIFCDI